VHAVEVPRAVSCLRNRRDAFDPWRRRDADRRDGAERSPHPFESARLAVENDDATIGISVGDIDFPRRVIDEDVGWSMEIARVRIAGARSPPPDLPQEMAVAGKGEQHIVTGAARRPEISRDPDAPFAVDRNAVLDRWPVIAIAGTTEPANEITATIKFENWRRRTRTVRSGDRTRTLKYPYIVVTINRNGADFTNRRSIRQMSPPQLGNEAWQLMRCCSGNRRGIHEEDEGDRRHAWHRKAPAHVLVPRRHWLAGRKTGGNPTFAVGLHADCHFSLVLERNTRRTTAAVMPLCDSTIRQSDLNQV